MTSSHWQEGHCTFIPVLFYACIHQALASIFHAVLSVYRKPAHLSAVSTHTLCWHTEELKAKHKRINYLKSLKRTCWRKRIERETKYDQKEKIRSHEKPVESTWWKKTEGEAASSRERMRCLLKETKEQLLKEEGRRRERIRSREKMFGSRLEESEKPVLKEEYWWRDREYDKEKKTWSAYQKNIEHLVTEGDRRTDKKND